MVATLNLYYEFGRPSATTALLQNALAVKKVACCTSLRCLTSKEPGLIAAIVGSTYSRACL